MTHEEKSDLIWDSTDKWERECQIAYKAFNESNVKQVYEQMHQQDIEEHNRMIHDIALLKDKIGGLGKLNQMTDEEVVLGLKAEIERHKALHTRAADALECFIDYPLPFVEELRKAAQ
jgi:hypothetical protein